MKTTPKKRLRELSLFTGGGGGLLASILLGWQTVHAVEIDPYCRRLIRLRQADGLLERFQISKDIRKFHPATVGHIDVVSGGFPCQPFSSAARGRNNAEDLWPEMLRVIKEAAPRYAFAENVERKPIERAAWELHRAGYSTRYCRLSSASVGAPHHRERYWLVAHTNGDGQPRLPVYVEVAGHPTLTALEWWQDDSRAMGIHHGVADRVDRMRILGNGQVPRVAEAAWQILNHAKW
jgi:DNA (cytosine-5)-methyltransferase 1